MSPRPQITEHALDRYIERVRPALDREVARADLAVTLKQGERVSDPPPWVRCRLRDNVDWLVVDDRLAFPVEFGAVHTCMVRDSVGAEVRWVGAA